MPVEHNVPSELRPDSLGNPIPDSHPGCGADLPPLGDNDSWCDPAPAVVTGQGDTPDPFDGGCPADVTPTNKAFAASIRGNGISAVYDPVNDIVTIDPTKRPDGTDRPEHLRDIIDQHTKQIEMSEGHIDKLIGLVGELTQTCMRLAASGDKLLDLYTSHREEINALHAALGKLALRVAGLEAARRTEPGAGKGGGE